MLGSPVLPNSASLGPRLSPSLSPPLPNIGSGSGKMTSGPRDSFPRSRYVYRLDYPLCLFKSIEPTPRNLPHSLVARMALLMHKPYQGKWGHSARLDQSGSTFTPGERAAIPSKVTASHLGQSGRRWLLGRSPPPPLPLLPRFPAVPSLSVVALGTLFVFCGSTWSTLAPAPCRCPVHVKN